MLDLDTFLLYLYVFVDDVCKAALPPEPRPGPAPALSRSEVVTLALFAQWAEFRSERGFARYATRHLRAAFPHLPDRSQLNRAIRAQHAAIVALGQTLAQRLARPSPAYEVLDTVGVRVRNAKRSGRGWLAGLVNIGWSNRLGWYEGFHLLLACRPEGDVSGFGFGPASAKDQPLAETFLGLRHCPDPRLPTAGPPADAAYLADNGFCGAALRRHWQADYGAAVIAPPKRTAPNAWPPELQRWHSHYRQIIETVNDKLLNAFGLDRERPHTLAGFQARLAAKVGLHNFCCWLNQQFGRPLLAFADLVEW
jgi:hypothetical protein